MDSYERARRTLERALAAHRRQDGLPPPASYRVELSGAVHARLQSPSPRPPFRTQALQETIWIDVASDRLAYRQSLEYPEFTFRERVYIDGDRGARATPWSDGMAALPEDALSAYRDVYRRVPPLVLEQARRRAASLRWVGGRQLGERGYELITFAEADGTLLTLYIEDESSLLSRIERLYSDPLAGDASAELLFENYDDAGGLRFPRRIVTRRAGVVVEELQTRLVSLDAPPPEDWPEEWPAPAAIETATGAGTVIALADDVYLLQGVAGPNYNVLAVAFEEYVLAVETPLSSEASQRVVERIGELFPGRPIRFAVPTHHHDDHAAGARAFAAAGATIVTTPGNRDFFQRMLGAERTIEPDTLSMNPPAVRVEAIEAGKRVFSDGLRVVEIHDVGPNPHAEEHLIAYLPREKLVFQGDLVVFSESGPIEPARPQGVIFAQRLAELGLDVEHIAGVHGRVGTIEELRHAVAAARDRSERR